MDTLEAERASLAALLDGQTAPEPAALHPGLANVYARKVAKLAEALNHEDTRAEAVDILRGLIERVILQPHPNAPNGHVIELHGELGAILSLCGNGMVTNAKARTGGAGLRQVTMVGNRWGGRPRRHRMCQGSGC